MEAILQKVLARIDSQDKRLTAIESTIKKLSVVVEKISANGNTQSELVSALNASLAKIKAHIADDDDVVEEVSAELSQEQADAEVGGPVPGPTGSILPPPPFFLVNLRGRQRQRTTNPHYLAPRMTMPRRKWVLSKRCACIYLFVTFRTFSSTTISSPVLPVALVCTLFVYVHCALAIPGHERGHHRYVSVWQRR